MVDDILHSFFSPKTSNLSSCLLLNSYCRSLSRVWLGFQVKMCHKRLQFNGNSIHCTVPFKSKLPVASRLLRGKNRVARFENHRGSNYWHKLLTTRLARNQTNQSFLEAFPQRLRKTGVRFLVKFLSRSFLLTHHSLAHCFIGVSEFLDLLAIDI